MSSQEATHGSTPHAHHVTPQKTLLLIAVLLFSLMFLTIIAANYAPPFIKNISMLMNLIAMGIAMLKAYFVVTYYMGVKYATKLIKLFAIGGFVWFLTLGITLIDYSSRQIEPVPGWEKGAPMGLPRDEARDEIAR